MIQYETDWNIDVENDGDDVEVNVDGDDDMAMDVDEPVVSRRSQSVMSASAGPSVRRSTRGPYKKTQQNESKNPISESIDADGHLPGARDGLGVFPPKSDLARTMFALKLKGKLNQLSMFIVLNLYRQEVQDQEGTTTLRERGPAFSC